MEKTVTADRLWSVGKSDEWHKIAFKAHAAAAAHDGREIRLDPPVSKELLCDAMGSVIADRYNYFGISSKFLMREAADDPDSCVSFQWRFHQSKEELAIERMLVSHCADQIVEDGKRQFGDNQLHLLMYFTWWLISFVEYGPEICDGIDYDEFSRAQSAHGAFLDHRAVCMGFSRALQMLCGRAGIECFTVMGQLGNGEYREHAWNMVVIDGQTAYIDMCFSKALSKEEDDGMSFPLLLDLSAMEQIGYTPSWRPFAPSVLEGELSKYRRVKMIDKGKKVA